MNLEAEVKKVITNHTSDVKDYKLGNKAKIGLFMGHVMVATRNGADPKVAMELLMKELS